MNRPFTAWDLSMAHRPADNPHIPGSSGCLVLPPKSPGPPAPTFQKSRVPPTPTLPPEALGPSRPFSPPAPIPGSRPACSLSTHSGPPGRPGRRPAPAACPSARVGHPRGRVDSGAAAAAGGSKRHPRRRASPAGGAEPRGARAWPLRG